MKVSKMVTTIIVTFGLGAMATTAMADGNSNCCDQERVVLTCQRAHILPDYGMLVELRTGGFAGLTQLVVQESFLGRGRTTNYVVQAHSPRLVGAPITYSGDGAKLTINMTTAPDPKGRPALLEIEGAQPVQLLCKRGAL